MSVLRIRSGVVMRQLAPAGARILSAVADLATRTSYDWELTCATEGHAAGNPHTRGEAEDFSLTPFPNSAAIAAALKTLRAALGPAYTVLLEYPEAPDDPILAPLATVNPHATGPHLHVQIKKGTTSLVPREAAGDHA
jgi:hypothetical protein